MRLLIEQKRVPVGEPFDVPDYAFDFAFLSAGEADAIICYLVPATEEDRMKAAVMEVTAHLMGWYK